MTGTPGKSLLIELGTEELPPKALDVLAAAFAGAIGDGLIRRGVAADVAAARTFCSPRRLAVWIPGVADTQPDQQQERRGPAITAGIDASGQPTRALLGFAASCGIAVDALQRLETDKGGWFVHRALVAGRSTASLLVEIIEEAVKALPIPKPMRWGDHDFAFVRPAHWLVVLHGSEVVDAEVLGLHAGRASRGHRFHHPEVVNVDSADGWLDALRDARVLADPAERRKRITDDLATVLGQIRSASKRNDLHVFIPADLLDEVANLTEWPVPIACSFESDFLAIPQEALSQTMRDNQKFFPVYDGTNRLTEHFIGVANIESSDPSEIRKGYERVIRPRFADARFFFDEDRKQPLDALQPALQNVTYQQQLGTLWDKTIRVAELARVIASRIGVDAGAATRAASLAKCDLLTRMVGEFPELQGIMGRYYASQGEKPESPEVATALDEFYRPRFAGDAIATGKAGQVLAIAERLDTLAGIFAIGMKPSGSKDPFALRRAALGLARTIIEGGIDLDLPAQLHEAADLALQAVDKVKERAVIKDLSVSQAAEARTGGAGAILSTPTASVVAGDVHYFIIDRLRGYYTDQGIGADVFEAVRAMQPSSLLDFDQRLRAVAEFAKLPDAQSLAAANKRIGNILRQAGVDAAGVIDATLLDEGAETALAAALAATATEAEALSADRDYVGLLRRLATLREPVDTYFAAVMVMAENNAVRNNRLALLIKLRNQFLRVADISLLQGQ